MRLLDRLASKRLVICIGSGGVGKTTLAAALAARAAADGRETLALTIDPARRLANSLGLEQLDNVETRIDPAIFRRAGVAPKGELFGMMLDPKRTFDDLIRRIAPSDEAVERILNNNYYQTLSDALAGSQEYMAMEKLYELQTERDYDLIVVDTPPTKHALDFLEAPNRMADFLDGKVIQWVVKPYLLAGKVGFNFARRGAAMMFKLLERFTGYEAMADLAEFFLAFDGMYEGFKTRALRVKQMLGSDQAAFVLITSPAHPAIDEAEFFWTRLARERMTPLATVFNRVRSLGVPDHAAWIDGAKRAGDKLMARFPAYAPAIDALFDNAAAVALAAEADQTAIAQFLERTDPNQPTYRIPALAADVHDVATLLAVSEYLK